MSKSIYKYQLEITGEQWVEMPIDAAILSVQQDPSGELCVWALVTPGSETHIRRVSIFGTGHPCDADRDDYVATVVCGSLVWHVFIPGHYSP